MDDYSSLDETSEIDLPEERNIPVKVITEEDLKFGTYTIDDVLLPLPGSRVIYPSNDIGEVYPDLAEMDGISLTETAHKIKEFSITNMTGAYRHGCIYLASAFLCGDVVPSFPGNWLVTLMELYL